MKARRARQKPAPEAPGGATPPAGDSPATSASPNPLEAFGRELGLAGSFSRMDLAGKVLNERGLTWAGRAGKSLFLRMCPTAGLLDNPGEGILRMHFNELCDRHEAGTSYTPATNAELICYFHGASLKAPLRAEALAALKFLITGTFLESALADVSDTEWWPGQTQEILSDLRYRFRDNSRA